MAKICILNALLLQLFFTSVEGQNSPCPDSFTYINKPGSNVTIGQIEIRNPSKNDSELHLAVVLSITNYLPGWGISTSFLGRVVLTKSKEDAARDILEGKSLLYHVHFNMQNPLPTVSKISLNNDEICSGPKVSGNVTTITLEHTLSIIRPPQQVPRPYPHQISRLTPSAPVDKIENYNECGISNSSGRPNLLISHGKKTLPGQWPWVAAIFRVIYEYEYICGGTILTTKHVLTAGHCLKTSPYTNETIPANILSVALGRYKLMEFNEQESLNMHVSRHISHPRYTHTASGDSDLAILILTSPVEFTAFIRPICLLLPTADSRRLEQKNGIVVGWGEDERGNRYTEEPRLANMPIVQTDVCVWRNARFATITSERTFCAGWLNQSGPCNGDSGSGLVIYDSITERYQLRGIVSRTLHGQQPSCDQTEYVVFVDVFKYLYWIYDQMYST